jgi:hypothetical protein
MTDKSVDVTSSADFAAKIPDIKTYGNPDGWKLICKASSKEQGWMKSTKAMTIRDLGVLVQVSTQQGDKVAEAMCFLPGASIEHLEGCHPSIVKDDSID